MNELGTRIQPIYKQLRQASSQRRLDKGQPKRWIQTGARVEYEEPREEPVDIRRMMHYTLQNDVNKEKEQF